MYKCLIVDDEELARELIERHLSQIPNFELVASCASAIGAHEILQSSPIDLIFMDIEMPVLKGTDFVKNLKSRPKVIFTTAYRDYAIEGFELDAVDYLLKPIVFERFFKAIEKFIAVNKSSDIIEQRDSFFIQIKKKNIKVVVDDILYVESLKDYVKIYFADEALVYKHGISAFEEKLNSDFIRIHRSYIVNAKKVTAFTKNDVEIGAIEIPIGDFYKEESLNKLNNSLD